MSIFVKCRRSGPLRIGSIALAAAGLCVGTTVVAAPASAAPTCASGYVCFWTGTNGSGTKYQYYSAANHYHRTASVYYNYNNNNISFWTDANGRGKRITGYTLAQRGFRNWTSNNWDICRSHMDHY